MDIVVLRARGSASQWRRIVAQWLGMLWALLLAVLWLLASVFVARRITGALDRSLTGIQLLGVVAGMIALVAALRGLGLVVTSSHRAGKSQAVLRDIPSSVQAWAVHFAPLPPLVALVASVAISASHWGGLLAAWGLVIAAEAISFWAQLSAPAAKPWPVASRLRDAVPNAEETAEQGGPVPEQPSLHQPPVPVAEVNEGLDALDEELPDPNVTQQWVRGHDSERGEWMEGWVRLPLVAGQRMAVAHISFCPPFERTPELECEILDGGPGRLRVSQVMPHGARLELRLTEAAETDASVTVSCAVACPAAE